jgi:hypothetical protein
MDFHPRNRVKNRALPAAGDTGGQAAVAAPRISRPLLVGAWARAGLGAGCVLGIILGGGFGAIFGIVLAIVGIIVGGLAGAVTGLAVGTLDGLVLAVLVGTSFLGPTASKRARRIRTRWVTGMTIVFIGLAAQLALSGPIWGPGWAEFPLLYVPTAAGALTAAVIAGKLPPVRMTRRVRRVKRRRVAIPG